jgi:hypothetical protein
VDVEEKCTRNRGMDPMRFDCNMRRRVGLLKRASGEWRINEILCDTLGAEAHLEPGWRNWQTQQTQNLPALVVMGVRPPLPAPNLSNCCRYK